MESTRIPQDTVVVGIDGSDGSERALDWAVAQAVLERCPLTLAHGIDAAGVVWTDPMGGSHQVAVDAMVDDGRRLVAAARGRVAELAPGLAVHESSMLADPRVMLLELATNARLVTVGSRGRGPVASLLLGSVGVALVRHAPGPVVVVRREHRGWAGEGAVAGVVAGVDGGPGSRAVVEFGYRQAALRELPLTILHCTWEPRSAGAEDDPRLPISEPLSGLAETYPDVRARIEIVPGAPAEELVAASRRMDLVVVGAHHGGRLSAVLSGSVSQSVVEHAECPVAVVP